YGTYLISKHAVVSYSEQLANALVGTSIGVSVLCPSVTRTRIVDSERNRQAEFGGPSAPLPPAASQPSTAAHPARVAEMTRDALRARRFYIFTDRAPRQSVLHRFGAIIEDFSVVEGVDCA